MKANHNGKSWRGAGGNPVFQYVVSGTAKELAAYKAARAIQRGVPESELPVDANGTPFWTFTMYPGQVAKKTMDIAINHLGTKIIVNDGAELMARSQRIDALVDQAMATEIARRAFERTARTANVQTATPVQDAMDTPLEEPTLEEQAAELQLKENLNGEKILN